MKKKKREKTCPICGDIFLPELSIQKYCSEKCFRINRCNQYKERQKNRNELNKLKFKRDHGDKVGKMILTCKQCGKEYVRYAGTVRLRGTRYCSNKCKGIAIRIRNPKTRTLDILWSEVVKLIAGNKCEFCGKETGLNSHHIFSRTNKLLRWDVKNGISLCAYHHLLGNFSAHKAPLEFAEWLKVKRGKKWYEDLRIKARLVVKIDRSKYKSELEIMKDKLTKYQHSL